MQMLYTAIIRGYSSDSSVERKYRSIDTQTSLCLQIQTDLKCINCGRNPKILKHFIVGGYGA